jgi:threonine aldolase
MAVGEAVVFFNLDLAKEFDLRCKQAGQLASKMRFLAAPWVGMLEDGAWLRHAAHANAMAARLESRLREIPGVELPHPRQANAVFPRLPKPWIRALQGAGWRFYDFFGDGLCRLMCSWDTTEADVDAFADDLRRAPTGA